MNYGFVKVASAIPLVKVADCKYNTEQIQSLIIQANNQQVEVVCFPELTITGYTCADLFTQQALLEEAEMQLINLMNFTRSMDVISIIGMPVCYQNSLMNCAVVLQKGKLLGIVPKTYLPNHRAANEKRWFTSATHVNEGQVLICGQQVPISTNMIFRTPNVTFGIEVGQDLWAPIPPSCRLTMQGADIIFNLSANSDATGKQSYLEELVKQQSARSICGYVYSSCGYGESTQDMVFKGQAMLYENGTCLCSQTQTNHQEILCVTDIDVERIRCERRTNTTFADNSTLFQNTPVRTIESNSTFMNESHFTRSVDAHPFVPEGQALDERCKDIFEIQSEGLIKRMEHTRSETIILGISGGLDSTLALLVCVNAFDKMQRNRRGIVGVTMPGFGTSDRTYTNAINLMQQLGITIREISIKDACIQHFKDIAHDIDKHNVVYENSQARERTQILMDVANQHNGLVVGTGDLSELALGWATYNGDHMSMYGVNASVPKTIIRPLVKWVAMQMDKQTCTILSDIVDTPISPELIPTDSQGNIAQVTEDLVGPYELHDFFLYYTLRWGFRPRKIYFLAQYAFMGKYNSETIKKWITIFFRRFFMQQFKRSCLPDGPAVGSCSLSPRTSWHMPSDASAQIWLDECESL